MKSAPHIVERCQGVWLAPWEGDPGRTLQRDSAKVFRSDVEARQALQAARRYRPFRRAQVVRVQLVEVAASQKKEVVNG